ncbi:MAG: NAD(P)H-dependent oxidoreductase subunit E [Alphaproteobacteria bacterium CG_4_10_14_0_2_um_filter_63_37]|nr:MAG: hypothetical protein AUJ55_01560 [Proteobacteria bacterium CG1_02_64_396]PJA24882.1 MAG: NAD(P)H-dependent oxidoreductase subunit E [Alphaproteobacteria bacterium CG_4_10_14_0_2_um_filter_63_37]
MARVQIYKTPEVDLNQVREILTRYIPSKSNVMGVLQDVQAHYGYVPEEACDLIAKTLRVPMSQIFGVLTFYGFFRLKPRGKYTVRVCVGTACHVKGAEIVGMAIQREVGLSNGEDTTDDGMFTYEEVACIGACGLAPLVLVDEESFAELNPAQVPSMINKVRDREAAAVAAQGEATEAAAS